MKLPPLLGAVIVCCVGGPAYARVLPSWPYERLMREADVVVVATPTAKRDIDFDFSKDKHFAPFLRDPHVGPIIRDKLRARVTTLKVIGMLRGERRASVEVLHFYWTKAPSELEGGPRFMDFTARRKVTFEVQDQQYLLFLRSCEDIHFFYQFFEPVSGQFDADLSFRLLMRP
jgi:hypothetical protein